MTPSTHSSKKPDSNRKGSEHIKDRTKIGPYPQVVPDNIHHPLHPIIACVALGLEVGGQNLQGLVMSGAMPSRCRSGGHQGIWSCGARLRSLHLHPRRIAAAAAPDDNGLAHCTRHWGGASGGVAQVRALRSAKEKGAPSTSSMLTRPEE